MQQVMGRCRVAAARPRLVTQAAMCHSHLVTAQDILRTVAGMPQEEWMKIQRGLADMITARFSSGDAEEIRRALAESEAEFARGEGMNGDEARRRLGLA